MGQRGDYREAVSMWEVRREIYDMLVCCLTSRGRVMPVSLMSRFLLPAYIRLISVWAEIGFFQVKEEVRTGISEGWQGCSDGFSEGKA